MRPAPSIRARLTALVLAVALPLVGLITYNAVSQARQDADDAQAQASRAAGVVAAETERSLARAEALLAHLARQPRVQSLDDEHCDPIFETFGRLFPQYTNLLTVRRNAGRVCSAVHPSPEAPSTVDPKLYLTQTLQSRAFTVGRATRGSSSGRWMLTVAYPLPGQAGNAGDVPGVVAVSMDLASLPLAPSLAELGPGAQAQIVDDRGRVLGSSTSAEQRIGTQLASTAPDGRHDADSIHGSAPVKATAWHAHVRISGDQVYAPLKRRAAISATAAVVMLALATLLAWLIARRIARPIEAIAAAARRAGASGPTPDLHVAPHHIADAPGEVRQLANDLRRMLDARTRAEQGLRDSEQSLAVTLHSIGDAVIATDRDGCITRMNATAERLTACPFAAVKGRPLADVFRIVDARTRRSVPDRVRRVLERGETVALGGHTVLIAADGSEFHIADSAAPIRDADGRIVGAVLVFSDITRQYRTQQALREREAQLRIVTDMLPGPVSHVDRQGRLLFVNAAYERWFGRRAGEVLGHPQGEVLPQALWREMAPHLGRVRSGERASFEAMVPGVGDGPLHALVTLLPHRAEDGSVLGHFMVAFDVTGLKQAEEALRRSEERLQLVLRSSGDAPWDWNMETGEWFYSPRWWDMIGHDRGHFPGDVDAARNAVHPDDRGHLEEAFGSAIRNGHEDFEAEFRLCHRDGHVVPVLSRGFILRDPTGRPRRVSGLNTDLTERKRAERERSALEAQLRESQKMESIGTLAGGIAHDFNNILGAILGNVALARQDLEPAHRARQSLEQINKAALRARQLVEQILAFSRRRPQALVSQPLKPLVEETLALLRSTLPASVDLRVALTEAPLSADVDGTQVQQVLLNLCTNAWHAFEGGSGILEVGLEAVELETAAAGLLGLTGGGRHAHLWVRDNGHGMDEATRSRIFEPFFTTKAVGQGTGLGLAVVHGIVASHHGAIQVESAVGAGTTFHLYLRATDPEAAVAEPVPAPAAQPAPRGHGERVLYVDDDEVMALMVERLLERGGYEVTSCLSAKEAVERLTESPVPIDFVVTDFNMPELSGFDVAQEVARTRPGVPVVIMSGSASEDLQEAARQAGVKGLLSKQNAFEELAPLIQRILAEKK